ncbi:MAG: DUF6783 domain-containing protein [Lachnospiraceae bacterium]|nr:DUF6783 domain-containing protein [Lachnospiraceae bacterium]
MKYPAKWGVQIAGMIFQTHSNVTSIPHIFTTHSYQCINYSSNISNTIMYYKIVLYQCQSCVTILYIITVITEIKIRISNTNYDNYIHQ